MRLDSAPPGHYGVHRIVALAGSTCVAWTRLLPVAATEARFHDVAAEVG